MIVELPTPLPRSKTKDDDDHGGVSSSSLVPHQHPALTWMQDTCSRIRENDVTMTRLAPPFALQDCSAQFLAAAVRQNHTLLEIELNSAAVTPEAMQVFLEAALNAPSSSVKTIRLISPQRKGVLASGLFQIFLSSDSSVVDSIEVSSDVMDTTCAKLLQQMLESNSKHVILLKLTNNDWIHRELAFTQVLRGLRHNSSLRVLSLAGSQINNTVAVALAAAIQNHPTLQELDLDENEIGDRGITVLAAALVSQRKFYASNELLEQRKKLMMNFQSSSTKSTSSSSSSTASTSSTSSGSDCSMASHACLRVLKLSWNHIGNRGLKALAEQLPFIKGLEVIELYNNPRISKSGLRALRDGTKESNHVQHIMISYEQRQTDRDAADEIDYWCQVHRLRAYRPSFVY